MLHCVNAEREAEERFHMHMIDDVVFDDDVLDNNGNRRPVTLRDPPLSMEEGRDLAQAKLRRNVVSHIDRIEWTVTLPATCMTPLIISFILRLVNPNTTEITLRFKLPTGANLSVLDLRGVDRALSRVRLEDLNPSASWRVEFFCNTVPVYMTEVEDLLPRFIDTAERCRCKVEISFWAPGANLSAFCVTLGGQSEGNTSSMSTTSDP